MEITEVKVEKFGAAQLEKRWENGRLESGEMKAEEKSHLSMAHVWDEGRGKISSLCGMCQQMKQAQNAPVNQRSKAKMTWSNQSLKRKCPKTTPTGESVPSGFVRSSCRDQSEQQMMKKKRECIAKTGWLQHSGEISIFEKKKEKEINRGKRKI